ncbi:MAG TPA: hypothetical protein VK718_04500 [Ferruginibacter sp.]|jgi:hypothetical protein|nr:hypothetical protein [Ferruginibacter sp.]
MLKLFFLSAFSMLAITAFACVDTVKVPFVRVLFHDKITAEQNLCDKEDGKQDGIIKVTDNDEINLQVTDVIFRQVNDMVDSVETNSKLPSNNDKVRYLLFIRDMVKGFRMAYDKKQINPSFAGILIDNFQKIMIANIDSISMVPCIQEVPYEVGKINAEIFNKNKGYDESMKILYLKFCVLHPDKILSTIRPYVNEPFADSLITAVTLRDPVQVYDYASAVNSPEGQLIRRSTNPTVKVVAGLSQTPNALFYFPFLDNILKGKITIDSIKKYVGDGDKVDYFKLLVKTEIGYNIRLINKDTPIAMLGPNGLRDVLQHKAIEDFIIPINDLHEQTNLNIRMKALDPLTAEEIYYVLVMGENDIYTSSYKYGFARMLQKMGQTPRSDQLLLNVNMDYFKKFIKMAANFNQLDAFLKLMPKENSQTLMKGFVANLDNTGSLEDAVDVADSYSSIKDSTLLKTILQNVQDNEERSITDSNTKGKIIYGLLKTIFRSANNPTIDLTNEIGIPSIYSINDSVLVDDSGRVIEQVFFYGDDDGKKYFPDFVNSFSPTEWKITMQKEWVEIKSIKGKKVWIFANRPLDNDTNLDDSAQIHLNKYLYKNDLAPSVVIHRGHSYWLPRTIARMPGTAKVIVLGSCGGYKNLNEILDICPDAHIISTKEIGKGDINKPILSYLNQNLMSGKTLVWKDMWTSLTKLFAADPNKDVRESWDDYIPPYKNLGAIFIKAYNKKIEAQ